MLQFIIGLSSLNVSWLFAGLFGGFRFYNSPALFFVGAVALCRNRFYSITALAIVGAVAGIGLLAAAMRGFGPWHLRQFVAFVAAATGWIFVYHFARYRDVFTMRRTLVILGAYVTYLLLVLAENSFGSNGIAYAVSCVFAYECGATAGYAAALRMPYFSTEASSAAIAIAATIMPFICATAAIRRNAVAYMLLAVALVVLYFAEGLTSQVLVLYSIAFVLLPRISVLAVPVLMVLIITVSASVSYVLEEQGAVIELVQAWFGGYSARVDLGIETGSYPSRIMNWMIGARAFTESPLLGTGIGGTQSYFYELYNAGFAVTMFEEQEIMVAQEVSAYSSPMVVRIPAEIGLLGTVFLLWKGWGALRLALGAMRESIVGSAFLYSIGAMLLSFCFEGALLNPCIPAFIALLAQVQRARAAADRVEGEAAATEVN